MFRTMFKEIAIRNRLIFNGFQIPKRYAGHSKWQNIRHIKGEKDAQRSMAFLKLAKQMKIAVAEGGNIIDPKLNFKLAQVLDQAKRANMPGSTVQNILKTCLSDKSQAKSHILEIKGPGSCFILCEIFSPHIHTTKQTIATSLRKCMSKYVDGGAMHAFEEKGIIQAELEGAKPEAEADILEAATNHAIESGAEDVQIVGDNILQFTCGKSNFNQVVSELEKIYKVSSASIEYVPIKLVTLQDPDLEMCKKLYERLEAMPEVVRVFDNIA